MYLYSQSVCLIIELLHGKLNVSRLILQLLSKEDIGKLLQTSRYIRTILLSVQHLTNKLYYDICLSADRSMLLPALWQPEVQLHYRQRLTALYEHERLDWLVVLRQHQHTLTLLHTLLSEVIEQDYAHAICSDVSKCLRNPDLPLPSLHHETVGSYCSSTLQYLLAELNFGRKPIDDWIPEEYLPLKKKLLELADNFKPYFDQVNFEFLKNLRYRPEAIIQYQKTHSLLVNIIQLILLLIVNHVEGLVSYFSAMTNIEAVEPGLCSSSNSTSSTFNSYSSTRPRQNSPSKNQKNKTCEYPYEFLLEFNLRYRLFRNSAIELDYKLGFVFEHYKFLFEMSYPEYCPFPTFHIWRFMQKMWVGRMKKFHDLANTICTQLMLHELYSNTERLIEYARCHVEDPNNADNQEPSVITHRVECMYGKQKKKPSQDYSELYLGRSVNNSNMFTQSDGACSTQLLCDHVDYLVDVSINYHNVHWCGSTEQRLGDEYRKAERQMVLAFEQFMREIDSIVSSSIVVKTMFESWITFLYEKLKPVTLCKMVKFGQDYLEGLRQRDLVMSQNLTDKYLKQLNNWRLDLPDFKTRDNHVDFLTRQRRIRQEHGYDNCRFFDFDKEVVIQEVDCLARDNSDFDSDSQLRCVYSYISNDSTDQHHEFEEAPQLNRIQSMT